VVENGEGLMFRFLVFFRVTSLFRCGVCTCRVRGQVRVYEGNASSYNTLNSSSLQRPTMTVLVTEPTSLSANPVYRVVYTNLLYFVVMFLVPLVVLLILNGELIRVLREKKAKRAQLMRGRNRLASTSQQRHVSVDAGR